MQIKLVFDDNISKEITYSGQMTFPQWAEKFFTARYFVLNPTSEKSNMVFDTSKIKFIELL